MLKNPVLLGVITGFLNNGALGRIRTFDRLVRSQVLYPAELRARNVLCIDVPSKREDGALGRIRTFDRLVRSQVLYPAELRARNILSIDVFY